MKILFAAALLAVGAGLLGAQGPLHSVNDLPGAHPRFRIVHGLVLGVDGKPAVGRKIKLIGLTCGSIRPYSDAPDGFVRGWNFTTDRFGRFAVAIGDFGTWDDRRNRPGWGTYALVAEGSANDAGAVSSRFAYDGRSNPAPYPVSKNDPWGSVLDLPMQGLNVTLQLKSGVTLRGTVEDASHPGRPLAGVKLSTYNDLGAATHTGHGGEILRREVTTDAQGRFMIQQIYPAAFAVQLDGATWLKTKVDGTWVEDVCDQISQPGTANELDLMASQAPSFHYYGRVVDGEGKPVAGAQVVFGVSYHPAVRTFEDDHTFCFARTRADGQYEVQLDTPWVRGIETEANGFQGQDSWADSDEPSSAPGAYNFTMERK